MVANSEQHSAPVMVSKPATAHANSSQPGAPLNRDDSADTIKIPDPIIEPITIIVASIGPSARMRRDSLGDRSLGVGPPSGRTGPAVPREGAPAPSSGRGSIRTSNHLSSRDTATTQPPRPTPPALHFVQCNAIFLRNFHWIEGTDRNIPAARWAV